MADLLWEMLANAGVKRCYGIVGDALNPVIDGLRRNGRIEFIHVRHEEYGVFAAVAEAYLPVTQWRFAERLAPASSTCSMGSWRPRRTLDYAIAGDVKRA